MFSTTTSPPCVSFPDLTSLSSSTSSSLSSVASLVGARGGFVRFRVKNSGSALYWKSRCWSCVFARSSAGEWDREGDSALEEEILEFMRTSKNPESFPSKKDLIDAGRKDLAMAISKQGGWLAMGWDLDEDDGLRWNAEYGDWEYRASEDDGNGLSTMVDCVDESCGFDNGYGVGSSGVSSFSADSSDSASSSGRSLETSNEDDSGIEGILRRLEKERSINFGLGLGGKGNSPIGQRAPTDTDERVADFKRTGKANKGNNDSVHAFSQSRSVSNFDALKSIEPEWRTWSRQRAASASKEFEAGVVSFDETRIGRKIDGFKGKFSGITEGRRESLEGEKVIKQKDAKHNQIQNRIKNLEQELSSVLGSLKSKADAILMQEGHQNSSEELDKLSDDWEFQGNEIMNAQHKLRSIRAKLAVLEGKMALSIIGAQKIVDEKQGRIDDTCKASRLIRSTFIVWTNPASEVLLVGSYDGWASKRKMRRTSSGIFTLYLKLYPGRHEIKFIVDGEWRIDPLRPIVNNNGNENNLLVIT